MHTHALLSLSDCAVLPLVVTDQSSTAEVNEILFFLYDFTPDKLLTLDTVRMKSSENIILTTLVMFISFKEFCLPYNFEVNKRPLNSVTWARAVHHSIGLTTCLLNPQRVGFKLNKESVFFAHLKDETSGCACFISNNVGGTCT